MGALGDMHKMTQGDLDALWYSSNTMYQKEGKRRGGEKQVGGKENGDM